jgi:hypothetical protein
LASASVTIGMGIVAPATVKPSARMSKLRR